MKLCRRLWESGCFRYTYGELHSNGALAEWLRSGLQNRVHRFKSGRCLHSFFRKEKSKGRVAELVYAADLKSAGLKSLVGSSPTSPTNIEVGHRAGFFVLLATQTTFRYDKCR